MSRLTLSVSQLNEYMHRMFQIDPMLHGIELKGEISNLKFYPSGMLFFTMRDEQAAISCVMYAGDVECLRIAPFDGMRAVATGSVGLYTRSGQVQFVADSLRAEGVGVLFERMIALRDKLASEGLFDESRKRPLPLLPDTVGVVSSPAGAVIHDILNVALRRDPEARILLCPARVQGAGSAEQIIAALHTLESLSEVDVIIVARGGGSMEDLWTFNEEAVVRAVAACKKPVVSAVGHETDVTLCDMVADLRAPTPSAAAECVVARRDELIAGLVEAKSALRDAALHVLSDRLSTLETCRARMDAHKPENRLALECERLAHLRAHLLHITSTLLERKAALLAQRKQELSFLSPMQVLSRGYALVLREGRAVEFASDLSQGDGVTIRFQDGEAESRVTCVRTDATCQTHDG